MQMTTTIAIRGMELIDEQVKEGPIRESLSIMATSLVRAEMIDHLMKSATEVGEDQAMSIHTEDPVMSMITRLISQREQR